jgi:hypothetical protein
LAVQWAPFAGGAAIPGPRRPRAAQHAAVVQVTAPSRRRILFCRASSFTSLLLQGRVSESTCRADRSSRLKFRPRSCYGRGPGFALDKAAAARGARLSRRTCERPTMIMHCIVVSPNPTRNEPPSQTEGLKPTIAQLKEEGRVPLPSIRCDFSGTCAATCARMPEPCVYPRRTIKFYFGFTFICDPARLSLVVRDVLIPDVQHRM